MRFCSRHRIHLISDEIYALSVFTTSIQTTPAPFISLLSIEPAGIISQDLIHVTYGLSKDYGSAGLKIGALITRNEDLKKAVHAVLRFSAVSGPSVAIAAAMLEDRVWVHDFITTSRTRIAKAYTYATIKLSEMGISYYKGGNAGFFLWIDLSKHLPPANNASMFERECMLAQKFVDGGVFLQPGEEHSIREGWFRIVFTMEHHVVQEGLRRVGKVLEGLKWV